MTLALSLQELAPAKPRRKPKLVGSPTPRIAPPPPAKHDLQGFKDVCAELGISPLPSQETAAMYLEAQRPDGRHLYGEVADVEARQNGKTTKLIPLIVKRLRAGRRIMHTAQNRELPREVFGQVADIMGDSGELLVRRGRPVMPRFANGQEEIQLANGGKYRIVAPTRGGARGPSNDDVIIDEVLELESFDFIKAAKPTLTASRDPQVVYLSNMGDEDSVVLNSIRDRAGVDPRLAYLEWSADPDLPADDRAGWAQANPGISHIPGMLEYLEDAYRANKLGGTMAIFETEHLCRSAATRRELLVNMAAWKGREVDELGAATRPVLAVSVDPAGRRAAAAMAWRTPDEKIALRLVYDVTGAPINVDALGRDLRTDARRLGITLTGFNPMTDAQLARYFVRKEPLSGAKWANASARFAALVQSGQLVWHDAAGVTTDLSWTARKTHESTGSFEAVRANDERPIVAANAAIGAVWLASEPRKATSERRRGAMGF
jgi:hypothetical protein